MSKMLAINDSLAIVPRSERKAAAQTDLQQFIGKYQPSKFKVLKNGIEVRSVYDLNAAMNRARSVINDLNLGLVVNHDANMAANRSFEVREVSK